ncbi:MAG: hypothetical protein JW720_02245 [Sedimentisphaerales bacterium]|nr:hypothetical protein [Sedimentisphaerales bacterium]
MKRYGNNLICSRCFVAIGVVLFAIWAGGCEGLMPAKNAGAESTRIIADLRRVQTEPEPNIPLPSFFTDPPKIIEQTVGGNVEFKLFYFCQHHTSSELQGIVHTQFASQLFDAKGKSTRVVDYGVSANPATNQLIVRCPNREDAEAVLDFLREVDVPPIQVKINCLISEVYADKTVDWQTTLAIEDLLGEGLTAVPAGQPFGTAINKLVAEPSTIAAFPGGSLRELARAKMGLKVGYLSQSGKFLAMVDTLESEGYLKILMNPTLEVINGKQAKVLSSQRVPLQVTYLRSGNSDLFESRQEYEDVVDSLTITPHVFGDGYIGLETSILLGSKLTPEGIKQVPIITKKQIDNRENRIRPGESLVIGGLRKNERRDVLRGIPILKDIPLLGVLFSGRDFEERAVETIFILTPTISSGGIPKDEMVDDVKRKHGRKTSKDTEDDGLDLFGDKARKRQQEREMADAERARIEAEEEKAIARHMVREAKDRIERAESETAIAKERSARAIAAAEEAKTAADTAKAEADAKAKAADDAKAAADKAVADAAKVKADAEKATADAAVIVQVAEKAKADAAKIAADATKSKEEAAAAKAQADALAAAAAKAKAEADTARVAAETAKATADKATADAAQSKQESEQAKAQADARTKAAEEAQAEAAKAQAEAEEAKLRANAKAAVADRAVAEAEKIIGSSAEDDQADDAEAAADSEKLPDVEQEIADPNQDSENTAESEKQENAEVVAKKSPAPEDKSTPAEPNSAAVTEPTAADGKAAAEAASPEPNETITAVEIGEAATDDPNQSTAQQPKVSEETVTAKAAEREADAITKKAQAKAPEPKIESADPRTRLLVLVLSALTF